jgi:hypothetical protein
MVIVLPLTDVTVPNSSASSIETDEAVVGLADETPICTRSPTTSEDHVLAAFPSVYVVVEVNAYVVVVPLHD